MKEFESVTTAKSSRNVSGGLNASIESGCYRKIQSDRSYPEIFVPNSQIASACGITASKIANGQTIAGVLGTYVGDTSTYSKIKYVEYDYSSSYGFMPVWSEEKIGTGKDYYIGPKTLYFSPNLKFKPSKVLVEFMGFRDTCSPSSSYYDGTGIGVRDFDYIFVPIKIGGSFRIMYRLFDGKTSSNRTEIYEYFEFNASWIDSSKQLKLNIYWSRESRRTSTFTMYLISRVRHMYFIE